jgi:hypothetical protein
MTRSPMCLHLKGDPVNQFKRIDMIEATRLTREGRLQDAVRLLLGVASSEFHASAA